MGLRRHRGALRRGAVVLTALALGTAAVGGVPTALAATGRGGVEVTVDAGPGSPPPVFLGSTEDLVAATDVSGQRYKHRTVPGRNDQTDTFDDGLRGVSAATLAELAGVVPGDVDEMTVTVPGGGAPLTLDRDEVVDGIPEDGTGPAKPVLFFGEVNASGEVRVIRPLRGSQDTNLDQQPPAGGTVAVEIRTSRPPVDVQIEGPKTVDRGAPVTFAVTAPPAASIVSIDWRFGDGSRVSGPTATTTHTFDADATRNVRAFVTTSDGASGAGVLTLRVGPAKSTAPNASSAPQPEADGPGGTPGSGTGSPGATPSGPDTGAGTASDAPDDGRGAAAATPANGTPERSRRRASSARRSERRSTAAGRVRASTPPAPGRASPPSAGTTPPTTTERPARRRPGNAAAPATPGQISGVLVASRTASVVPISPAGVARAAAARRGAEPKETSDLARVLGPLAVVGLLGAGAVRELRPRRRTLTTTRMPTT